MIESKNQLGRIVPGLLKLITLSILLFPCLADDMYCGRSDCYEILGVTQQATPSEIKRSFYKLSLIYHPDKVIGDQKAKEEAETKFRDIVTAYEVLSDPDTRVAYNEAIAHPEQYYRNRYRYYRFHYGRNQANVWVVIGGFVALCTVAHYLYWWSRYLLICKWARADPRVQARLKEKARAKKQAREARNQTASTKPGKDAHSGSVVLDETDDVDLSEVVHIGGWQGRAPTWQDLLVWKILFVPWHIYVPLHWWMRWLIKFRLLRHEYGPEERSYLTAVALRVPFSVWESQFPVEKKQPLIDKELWIPANFSEYKREAIAVRKQKYR